MPDDPRFTFPPFNTGVPQYDTPNVPNFEAPNSAGDLILVEMIPVEIGSYDPQPDDGSIQYANPDKNKWPSPLYLCKTVPSADGKTAIRYWANQRPRSPQNPWNFDYNYSGESASYPIIIRRYLILRSDYTRTSNLASDPVVSTCLLVKEDMQELPEEHPLRSLFVIVVSVYETIPGPTLVSYDVDADTHALIEVARKIVLPTNVPSESSGVEEVQQAITANKSLLTVRQFVSNPPGSRNEYRLIDYDFPSCITGVSSGFLTQTDGTQIAFLNLIRNGYKRLKVPARISIEYFTSEPAPVTFTTIAPQDLIYNGIFFNLDERYVLTDGFTITYTTGSGNPIWGSGIVESVTVGATTPGASTYLGWVGNTEIVIGSVVQLVQLGLWRRVTTYVIAR